MSVHARDLEHADVVARAFHEKYEQLAPMHGWETQHRSRREWEDVPAENRALMVHVADDLIGEGIIWPGPTLTEDAPPVDPGLDRMLALVAFAVATVVLIAAIAATHFAPLAMPAALCAWMTYVLTRGAM